MALHQLKTWTAFFRAIEDGSHTFTMRKDDRVPGFAEGDWLIFEEFSIADTRYTGRTLTRQIGYVLRGGDADTGFGAIRIEPGYAVLGLRAVTPDTGALRTVWPEEVLQVMRRTA